MSDSTKRKRKRESEKEVLDAIMNRLNALEDRLSAPPESQVPSTSRALPPAEIGSPPPANIDGLPAPVLSGFVEGGSERARDDHSIRTSDSVCRESATTSSDAASKIIEVLSSITKVRPVHYFISNFDPSIHNFDVWCEEVDRAKDVNNWNDNETLSRIGGCLKGDSRVWLNEWSTNDRSWSNFKREFKTLCPQSVDIANILFEVMSTDSRNYTTYAEYARRSLLKLGIVRGLSDELTVAIVIRGIAEPQIRAAATNAKLSPQDIVEFLSIYIKPRSTRESVRPYRTNNTDLGKSHARKPAYIVKCFNCGSSGHKQSVCSKRPRLDNRASTSRFGAGDSQSVSSQALDKVVCTFCKKTGHLLENCFARQRSESSRQNPGNVNFCSKMEDSASCTDVMTAVIQGVPVDVLIDSGSCISLVSQSLLKHFVAKRNVAYRVLRGIGSQVIESTYFVTLVLEFSEISLEVDLFVIPNGCLCTPVIIGTDVLNREGVVYVRQRNMQSLTHKRFCGVNVVSQELVVYQRIISKTLQQFIDSGDVLVYIDDVLLLSNTISQGLELLRLVLHKLTTCGFSINLKKCTFLTTEIEYLGRIISQGQVRPSPRKVQSLVDSKKPTNVKQVRQFLGLAGYFRRYIPDYAIKTACIAHLTKKNTQFVWSSEQEAARKFLIDCLTSEPVLIIFDPKLPTELHTDASAIGYGADLLQTCTNNQKRVVAYFSKSTQGAEPRYHSYELETLAIVKSLQHFRHYLLGISFKVVTDCNALKLTERKKDLLPRVARWWVYMQDFQFTLEYRKGVLMSHADYLSRNPVGVLHVRNPKNWAQIAQSADEDTLKLIEQVKNNQLDDSRYIVRNDLLYYKLSVIGEDPRYLCYIPKGYRLSLLHVFHDDHDHIGADKTTELILRHFWFPGLRQFVRKYIKHCLVCLSQKRVPRAPQQPIVSWSKPDEPFSVLHMDVLGPIPESRGYKFILIIVDAFSKYCLLYPLYRQDADDLKRVFKNAIALFGSPKLIVTDRGRMFESSSFQDWMHSLGCEIHFITPGMHHENGQVERYCRTVLNMLRVEVNARGSSWSDILWRVQLIINVTKHNTTHTSALQLLVGIDGTTPVIRALVRDTAQDISMPNREGLMTLRRQRASALMAANLENQDAYVNKSRKQPRIFKQDDLVFVIKSSQASGKLDSCMRGPYQVIRALPHDRYELKLLAGSYGKRTEAAAQNMISWEGEWTPDACAAFFECDEDDGSDSEPGHSQDSKQPDGVAHGSELEGGSRSLADLKLADEDVPRSGEAV